MIPEPIPIRGDEELFKDYKFFKDNVNLKKYGSNKYERINLIADLIKYEQPVHKEDIYESMKVILNKKKKD